MIHTAGEVGVALTCLLMLLMFAKYLIFSGLKAVLKSLFGEFKFKPFIKKIYLRCISWIGERGRQQT
jgi:hypothetical protein